MTPIITVPPSVLYCYPVTITQLESPQKHPTRVSFPKQKQAPALVLEDRVRDLDEEYRLQHAKRYTQIICERRPYQEPSEPALVSLKSQDSAALTQKGPRRWNPFKIRSTAKPQPVMLEALLPDQSKPYRLDKRV